MQEKQRHKAQQTNKVRKYHDLYRPKVKGCPFCATPIVTNVSYNGVRFFECGNCGLKASFMWSDETQSLEDWNNRS